MFPDEANAITIDEGFWDHFSHSRERAAQHEADKVSYAWDTFIEHFTKHAPAGTQYYTSHLELSEQEKGAERPGLTQALEMLRTGDTLIVWRLDRLGHSLSQLIALITEFEQQHGIGFRSLTE